MVSSCIDSVIENIVMTIGQPVAWLISHKEDHLVIKIFLNAIKARSPDTTVKTIMTDDGK